MPTQWDREKTAAFWGVSVESTWKASDASLAQIDSEYKAWQKTMRGLEQGLYILSPWRRVGVLDGDGSFMLSDFRIGGRANDPKVYVTPIMVFTEHKANRFHLEAIYVSYGFTGGNSNICGNDKRALQLRLKSQRDLSVALRFHRTYPPLHSYRHRQWRYAYRAWTYRRYRLLGLYAFQARLMYFYFAINHRAGSDKRRKLTFYKAMHKVKHVLKPTRGAFLRRKLHARGLESEARRVGLKILLKT